jgi:hypothetical protein
MNKIFEKKALLLGAYACVFLIVALFTEQCWSGLPISPPNFLNWDAEHYDYIRSYGYQDFRVAFFPLFPLLWRILALDAFGISIINALIFLTGFYILTRSYKITRVDSILLYLTIPGFLFFYLPYSESLFFLCSVLILLGLKENKSLLVYSGLFLSILSRPAFTVFIPAFIITELMHSTSLKSILRIDVCLLISAVGLFIVGAIQYADTGEWFQFFSVQKEWGNELQVPKLPLTSWAGSFIVKTDGFALLIGALAGGYLASLLLKLKWIKTELPGRDVLFSLAYLGGISLTVLLFRGGSLFSLNRFILATPFIVVALHYWLNQEVFLTNKELIITYVSIFLFWLLLGSYVHIQELLKYALLSFYALFIFSLKSNFPLVRKYSLILLIALNFIFQVTFYVRFLSGLWVG